ncbi:DUF4382 domain-containing protein [Niabella sp.]|uniref:DUF4382 domain-containing protein n=1 Tax=Niabella sp. TaxID=1962976 RepID=UPI00261AEDA9|nr:DUF4382 domain-containing protein [Niabella sp.]
MKQTFLTAALVGLGSFLMISCNKNDSQTGNQATGPNTFSVYLTDAPVNYDAVFIDIVSIEAKIDSSTHKNDDHYGDQDDDHNDYDKRVNDHDQYGKWTNLNVVPGLYDVLKLRNGLDSLVAQANVNGTVRKIRIQLGDGSYLMNGGTKYPLTLVNDANKKNYVYIKLRKEDRDEDDDNQKISGVKVWIDFDLGRSIIERNGKYYLLPVLKAFCDRKSGKIEGKVLPADAAALVKAINGTDTATALPDKREGSFKIRGLKAGTYKVWYQSTNGYKDTTINNVVVTPGKEVKLPTVVLKK